MPDDEAFSMDFQPVGEGDQGAFAHRGEPLPGPLVMRGYLAGPLTCNSQSETAECEALRNTTKRVLGSYDFEGFGFTLYDPADVTRPGSNHTPDEVFETDYRNVVEADFVVFNVTSPSLGVGEESIIAASATVPRVVIFRDGVKVSRMFLGTFTPAIVEISYQNLHDYERQLSTARPIIGRSVVGSARRRRPLMVQYEELGLGSFILKQRIRHGIALDELARQIDTKESWLYCLERDSRIAATASHMLIDSMLQATNSSWTKKESGAPVLREEPGLEPSADTSLKNLVTYIQSQRLRIPDRRAFRLWNRYLESREIERSQAVEFRGGDRPGMEVDDWRKADDELGLGL